MSERTWMITGASSGFGYGLTETLLARGDRVWATVRRAGALDALVARYGDRLRVDILDVTDIAAIRRGVDRAFGELGRLDVVVSNAGYGVFGAAEEASDEVVAHQIATNLTGSIALIRASLPHLRAQGGGRILQVSSEGGQIAYPAFSLYHATKWGIEGFVEAVAQEVAPFGIALTLVEPGPAGTNFAAGMVRSTPLPAYDHTPAGDMRRAVDGGGFAISGDPNRMVDAMVRVADQTDPPLRLVLGGSAYTQIREALTRRRDALDAQRDVAFSTDRIVDPPLATEAILATTLPLVDPDARAIVTQVPPFDPTTQSVDDFRALVDSLYAVLTPLAGEERRVPGPPGAPDGGC